MRSLCVASLILLLLPGFTHAECVDYRDYLSETAVISVPGGAMDIVATNSRAYIAAASAGLHVYDISNPALPSLLGSVDTPGSATALVRSGSRVFVADGQAGLQVIDITDPANPEIMASLDTPGQAVALALSGNTLYLADGEAGLQIIDITDPADPAILGTTDTPGTCQAVALTGHHALVADGDPGLQVIDVGDPQAPAVVANYITLTSAEDVVAVGSHAYVGDAIGELIVLDLSAPLNPVRLMYVHGGSAIQNVHHAGSRLFLATGGWNLVAVDIANPAAPEILFAIPSMGGATGMALVGGNLLAAYGNLHVADASSMQILSPLRSLEGIPLVYDLQIRDNLVYALGDSLWVIGSEDPFPVIGSLDLPASASDLSIAGDLACATGAAVHILDVSDPASPSLLSSIVTPIWLRDAALAGQHVYVVDYNAGLFVYDLSNPSAPQQVAQLDIPEYPYGITIIGEVAYVTGYDAPVSSGITLVDISIPSSPQLIGLLEITYDSNPELAVHGSLAYFSGSAPATAGMFVADVSDPSHPQVLGESEIPGGSSISLAGTRAYLGRVRTIRLVDFSPFSDIVHVGTFYAATRVRDMAWVGGLLWVAGTAGLHIYPAFCDAATGVAAADPVSPLTSLRAAPNPSADGATVRFRLPAAGPVRASVYDAAGRLVRTLHEGAMAGGEQELSWDGRDEMRREAAPGVYFVRLTAAGRTGTARLVLVR